MYKNAQGNTVSVAQMQKWADLDGMSIGEYATSAGYSYVVEEEEVTEVATTPITTETTVDAGKEKDFVDVTTETKSTKDVVIDPPKSEKLSELESKLETYLSEYQEARKKPGSSARKLSRDIGSLRIQIKAEKNRVFNPEKGPDFKDSFSLVNESEETVEEILEKNLPIQITQSDVRNAVTYKDPKTGEDKYINLKPATYDARLESARQIDALKKSFENLTAEEYGSKIYDTFIDRFEQGAGPQEIEQLNYGLDGTGYEIKTVAQTEQSVNPLGAPVMSTTFFQVYKDGELVDTLGKEGLADFFSNNLTDENQDALKKNAYKAYSSFEDSVIKRKEIEKEKLGKNAITKDYLDSGSFNSLLKKTLVDQNGFTDDEATVVEEYLNNKKDKRRAIKGMSGRTRYVPFTPEGYIQYKTDLSGLPDEIKAKLTPALVKEIFSAGYNRYAEIELDSRMTTISEALMKESGKKDLLKLASRFTKEDEKLYKEKKKAHKNELLKTRDNISKIAVDEAERLSKLSPGTEFKIQNIDGNYVFTANQSKEKLSPEARLNADEAMAQWYKLQKTLNNAQADFQEDVKRYIQDIGAFEAHKSNQEITPEKLFDLSMKEYGTGALLAKDFNDAVAGLLLAVPTVLGGSEYATQEQARLNRKNEAFETMLTYDQAIDQGRKGLFTLRTATQQAPNIILAIATSGAGTAVNLSKIGTQLAVGTQFGISSGAQKYRDLTLQQSLGEAAKNQKDLNKKAYDMGMVDYSTYALNELDLNKTIAMGDLTDQQIVNASWATGAIEGTVTSLLGTAPNSLKAIKDFSKSGVNISNFLYKSNLQKLGMAGLELGKRLSGEILEEELIYFGDTALSEGLILGRDMDFSQWDDTAVSALITSGAMTTPGIAYSALMTNAATIDFQKDISGLIVDIQGLSTSIQEATDTDTKDVLIAQLATKMKEQSFAVQGLEVDAIALGGDNQKKMLGLARLEKQLLSEAGVKPGDSQAIAEEKINNYKAKLKKEGNSQQAENFDIRRSTIQKQQNTIKEDVNYDRVENSLGDSGKRIKRKLETTDTNKANEYRSLNRKDKLTFIINEIRNEQRLGHVKIAKESPAVVKKVESLVDANGKPLSKTAKEKVYASAGANLMFNKGRAITLSTTAKASSEIVNTADLTILEASNKEEAQKLLEDTDLDDDAKNVIYESLEKEGSNGFIYDNKYITFNKEKAEAAIREGNILQATAIVHEIAHAIDDRVFDTPEKQKQYADNLQARLSQPDLAGVDQQVNDILQNRQDLEGDKGKKWEDTSADYKDEYTKVAQEIFYAFEAELNQEAKRSKESFFNRVNTTTPEGALNYMLNRNADFREGKIGKRIQNKVKKGPKVADLKKGKASYSTPDKFKSSDKADLFTSTNNAFNEAVELYGLDLSLDEAGNPNFTKEQWDAVDDNTKLGIGFMIGEKWQSYVGYLMKSRDQVPGYVDVKDEIIDRASTGVSKGDDGVPFLIKTYNPAAGTKLTTHIFGQVGKRLQGVIDKTPGFGEITVEAAPVESGKKELVGKENADDLVKRKEKEDNEVKKEFPQIADEVIVLDKDGNPISIAEQVQKEVKNSVKVAYATTKFTAPIGSKKFRTELANAMRGKLGNLFKSIMDRGSDFDNNETVGNKEKRANYDSFVDRNFQNVYSIMPKSTISDRFPFLMEEITNEDGSPNYMSVAEVEAYNDAIDRGAIRGKRIANKYANNRKFKKRGYDGQVKKEGTEYLKANDKATNVRNARKTSFADVIAEEAAFDVLPEVLRENGLAKEAEVVEIEKQTGRGKFSVGRMDPNMRFKFDLNKDLFFDRVMSLKTFSKGNIKKVFLSTYSALDFDAKIIDGVAEQFANRLQPVSKAAESVPIPVFKQILIEISNQADEALALQKLVGAQMNASEVYRDESTVMLARGAAIENMQMLVDKYGPDEALQLVVAFGSSTFSSQGAIGLFKFDLKLQKLVKGLRNDGRPITKAGADLFSGSEDLMQSLYNGLDLGGKKIKEIKNKEIIFTDGTSVARKYSPVTSVTQGMLKEGYVPDAVNYKAAQKFVTSFFENFAKQNLDPNVALALLNTMNNGSSNALRAAARVWGKSTTMPYKTTKVNGKRVYIFEHAIPARVVLAHLYEYHVNGNKSIDISALWDDYRVTIIPIAEMDNVLTNAGYSSITTSSYVPGETAWHNRYYNLFTRGRMPYAMVSYDGKETVGESYQQYFNEKGEKPLVKIDAAKETESNRVADEAMAKARTGKYSQNPKKIRVFDFDDTLAQTKSNVLYTMPDGTKGKIDAATFAKEAGNMEAEGAVWDFSEFSKVMNGTKGPLFEVAKIIADKRGTKDVFVLTARPADAAGPIQQFLSELGLDIPLANITGLGNGTPKAKADWIIGKVSEGYNDFYFADDHTGNVKAVKNALAPLDVKGKVQLAKVKFSMSTSQKLTWKDTDEALVAKFKVGTRNYEVTLEETAFMEFDEGQTYQDIEDMAKELGISEDKDGDGIESSERFFHLEFGDTELGKGITGEGNAFKVFSTAINGVADYINKKKKIEGVIFTAKEPSRIRLYKTLSRALSEKINGSFSFKNNTFIVSKNPPVSDNISNQPKQVQDVLNTFDIKRPVQKAKIKFSMDLDTNFNEMIERQKGIGSVKEFSKAVAQRRGKNKGRFKFFIPPSAEDFRGLTQYTFAGKGKQGEADQKFFEEALMDPYFKGVAELERARQQIKNDTTALLKMFKPVKKKLNKLTPDGDYTYDNAVRVYLWTQAGVEIPGISKRDQAKLQSLVAKDAELSAFAEGLLLLSKKSAWPEPTKYWNVKTTLSDLNSLTENINRKEYLAQFIENVDIIFSEKNLNKVEAAYGESARVAIENAIFAMKTGSNSPVGKNGDPITSRWLNWVNNSVGTIMFFNRRSAILQLLSATNFINWSDNNPAMAALAFANQPQYWKDFVKIFNSDKLKQRRGGLKSDVQESEIANAAKDTKDKAGAVIAYILKLGFTPTQIADSFAISMGGATMYRNRINTYKKQGLSEAEAETKAWEDFSKLSDEAQQSGDPALVSQQQRSIAGRLILSFQNTTMQYTRLMKKASQDLINGRGDAKTHISKILYYGAVQNFIFNAMSTTLFALIPGFDEDEEDEDAKQKEKDYKVAKVLNGMGDSIIRGTGIYGAIFSTLKNTYKTWEREKEKGFKADQTKTIIELANLSPPIGSKLRKTYTAIQTYQFDKAVIDKHPWDVTIDGKFNLSPTYSIIGNLSSAYLNIPLDRAIAEVQGIAEALDNRNSKLQRIALAAGWRTWNVGAKNEEFDLIKAEAAGKRKEEGIEKSKETRRANKIAKVKFAKEVVSKMSKEEMKTYRSTPNVEKRAYLEKIGKQKGIKKEY